MVLLSEQSESLQGCPWQLGGRRPVSLDELRERLLQVGHPLQRGLEVRRGQLQQHGVGLRRHRLGAHQKALPLPDVLPNALLDEPAQEAHNEAFELRGRLGGLNHRPHEELGQRSVLHELLDRHREHLGREDVAHLEAQGGALDQLLERNAGLGLVYEVEAHKELGRRKRVPGAPALRALLVRVRDRRPPRRLRQLHELGQDLHRLRLGQVREDGHQEPRVPGLPVEALDGPDELLGQRAGLLRHRVEHQEQEDLRTGRGGLHNAHHRGRGRRDPLGQAGDVLVHHLLLRLGGAGEHGQELVQQVVLLGAEREEELHVARHLRR
mmetsp:Transcript_34712/g.75063  ORF Transcript_34712/g.75063 Transcript_34712/m.75063 type:complete len:324 (-) Transcript_34712:316-1287(-)